MAQKQYGGLKAKKGTAAAAAGRARKPKNISSAPKSSVRTTPVAGASNGSNDNNSQRTANIRNSNNTQMPTSATRSDSDNEAIEKIISNKGNIRMVQEHTDLDNAEDAKGYLGEIAPYYYDRGVTNVSKMLEMEGVYKDKENEMIKPTNAQIDKKVEEMKKNNNGNTDNMNGQEMRNQATLI